MLQSDNACTIRDCVSVALNSWGQTKRRIRIHLFWQLDDYKGYIIGIILWSITVKRTQPGPPDVFLPITRRVQNKRIRVRSYRTNRKWGTCGEKFISINEKATKYYWKAPRKTLGGPGWVRYTVKYATNTSQGIITLWLKIWQTVRWQFERF